MITDNDRNVRTIIVSFVIAIMALIPLRFYEVGQQSLNFIMPSSSVQVLGESTESVSAEKKIVLPVSSQLGLDPPWDEIDGKSLK